MNFNNILGKWGIDISNNYDNAIEYLYSTQPEKCYFIDRFPLLIKDFEKYQQEEMYYDKNLTSYNKNEEMKFVNIIRKLWLYNSVLIETELLEVKNEIIKKTLEDENNTIIFDLKDKLKITEDSLIESKNVCCLSLLVKLGAREAVATTLVFVDYEIIIDVYGMCFQIYLNDLSKLQLIKEIISTEGLYLRNM